MSLPEILITQLEQIVGKNRVVTEPGDLQFFGVDRTTQWQPNPSVIVFPGSTGQVLQLVSLANREKLPIVPSGGRTGLSGGAVAANGELVISLEKLNRLLEINPTERTLRCEAGMITQHIQEKAMEQGLFYPVDFAAAGSSQIGGNIATNAGGMGVLKYGMTRNWVRGLTVVTGAGELLELNHGLLKNNSGYDFRHLLIGSEGTLGLICEAILGLTTPPQNPNVILLGLNHAKFIPEVVSLFLGQLSLTACEFFSHRALEKVLISFSQHHPLEQSAPFYLLIEFEQPDAAARETVLALFAESSTKQWVADGVISNSQAQANELWRLRESITDVIAPWQPYKMDIAVSPSKLADFISAAGPLLSQLHPGFEVIWFGHAGDGNLHLNILKPKSLEAPAFNDKCRELSRKIASLVREYRGTISAEHGIGLLKKSYLTYIRSEEEIALMKQVKKVFDPNGIMNPGKVFD